MEHQDKLEVGRNDRPALERESQRLAKALLDKGVITSEGFERLDAEPQVMEPQVEPAPPAQLETEPAT